MKLRLKKFTEFVSTKPSKFIKRLFRQARYYFLYRGNNRFCPVCEKTSKQFITAGKKQRKDARCSFCNSLERHRFQWYYLINYTNLFDERDKTILHVAPETHFEKKLKELGNGYITADLYNPQAMVKMDITNIQYSDEYFDVILCSHVLEHVQNDRAAIEEFFRVLKKDGWALLIIPISFETKKTFEDPSITDSEERIKYFGQKDHVRKYGIDFVDRLKDAGFSVKTIAPKNYLAKKDIAYMGIKDRILFYCTK